jgi:hypothetical protein
MLVMAGSLAAVSILSPTDAWAAGPYQHIPPQRGPFRALTLRWNGTSRAQVPSPTTPTKSGGGLSGVRAVSASQAWAAGSYMSTSSPTLNPS